MAMASRMAVLPEALTPTKTLTSGRNGTTRSSKQRKFVMSISVSFIHSSWARPSAILSMVSVEYCDQACLQPSCEKLQSPPAFPTAFPEACTLWNTCQPYSPPAGGAVGKTWPLAASAQGPPAHNAFWNPYPPASCAPSPWLLEDTGRLKAQAGQGLLQRRKHRVNVLRRHVTHVADAEALASQPAAPLRRNNVVVVHEHGQEGRVRDALREVAGGHGVGGVLQVCGHQLQAKFGEAIAGVLRDPGVELVGGRHVALGQHLLQGMVQAVDETNRRGPGRLALVEGFARLAQVEVEARHRGLLGGLPATRAERHHGETRRARPA